MGRQSLGGGFQSGDGIGGDDFIGGLPLATLEAGHLPEQARRGGIHAERIDRIITPQSRRFQGGPGGRCEGEHGQQNEHERLWHINMIIVSQLGLLWQGNPRSILGRGSPAGDRTPVAERRYSVSHNALGLGRLRVTPIG